MTDGTDTWSVDPTIRFSSIHIIESLDSGFAGRTGTRLFGDMEAWCSQTPVRPVLHQARGRAEVLAVLAALAMGAENGDWPLIHFETHGAEAGEGLLTTAPGLILASSELMFWKDLTPLLTSINRATRLNLIVFMAACNGADLATLIQPLEGAPARIIIGPTDVLRQGTLEKATNAFYRSVLAGDDGTAAIQAIIAAVPPTEAVFLTVTAEMLFLQILQAYFNQMTTEDQISARVEAFIAPLALLGVPPIEMARRRVLMKAQMADRQGLFDACYRAFFFVNQHPHNAERFLLSFDRCFREATG